MKQEMRTLNVAIRAAAKDDLFELHGTAVSYNVLTDIGEFRERVAPGAFTRSLASGSDVKCLFNHSQNHVLGRTANGTLQLFDTPQGLNFCCRLDSNQQAHRDLHSSVKRGDISECSFAFRPTPDGGDVWEDVNERGGVRYVRRTIKNADLFDCSVVTTPAYGNGATKVVARSGVVIPTREKSLEEKFFESHGRWPVTDQDLRTKADVLAAQIRRDAAVIKGDEQLRARVEEVGRRLRIEALIAEMEEMVGE
jgi:hypothetical protein